MTLSKRLIRPAIVTALTLAFAYMAYAQDNTKTAPSTPGAATPATAATGSPTPGPAPKAVDPATAATGSPTPAPSAAPPAPTGTPANDTPAAKGSTTPAPTAAKPVTDEAKAQAAAAKKADKKLLLAKAEKTAEAFLALIAKKDIAGAYAGGAELLRTARNLETFTGDIEASGLTGHKEIKWVRGVPAKDGYRLTGDATLEDGSTLPFYINLLGDADVDIKTRNRSWNKETNWSVLDVQASGSVWSRIGSGNLNGLDIFILFALVILLGAFFFMVGRYIIGLRGSPYELYLMFFTKVTEYSAYGAASYCFVLYLDKDVGLGISGATAYYTVFSLTMTVTVMVVGAVCDTIGIKKSLLIGAFMLLVSRFFMPLSTDLYVTSILGFLPFALGVAITGPVLKVGIKKFTTIESATLGFGLFYTLMNVGFMIGGWMFDKLRTLYGDGGSVTLPLAGVEISTYQLIIGVGFLINIPDLIAVLMMREGAEMTENGARVVPPVKPDTSDVDHLLAETDGTRKAAMFKEIRLGAVITGVIAAAAYGLVAGGAAPGKWGWATIVFIGLGGVFTLAYGLISYLATFVGGMNRIMHVVRTATEETGRRLKENFSERPFWIYLFMLAVLCFVRLTFFIFHVMFPTYGIRVFGEGAMVGSIFGVLNPAMIVFLVPLISLLTTKIRSYTMLLIGTGMSAGAVFLCFVPESVALGMADSWFGSLIFDRWLEVPYGQRDPFYMSLILFIIVFTIGEAIWSPRLMQFSAEIAPRGKEGAYIALAILPYFVGKALAGGMSGFLLTTYTPEGAFEYPDHQIVWLWIGGMAAISPIGLVVFRKLFNQVEEAAVADAKAYSEQAQAEAANEANEA